MGVDEVIKKADEAVSRAEVGLALAETVLHDHATRRPPVAVAVARGAAEGEEKMS